MNDTSVESWLEDGCGRCELYQTPACKVHRWTEALVALRALVVESGLAEQMKWGSPCYTLAGKNVVMLVAFKEHCALSFFKGALLADPEGLLESAGPNSRHIRQLRFTSVEDVTRRRAQTVALLERAIEAEKAGLKVAADPMPEAVPTELEERLAADAEVRRAFDALTPGRRRSHILYVGGARQSATRQKRVERCVAEILAGRGFNER